MLGGGAGVTVLMVDGAVVLFGKYIYKTGISLFDLLLATDFLVCVPLTLRSEFWIPDLSISQLPVDDRTPDRHREWFVLPWLITSSIPSFQRWQLIP
jgi:hypothetical protein